MKGVLQDPLDRRFAVILQPDEWEQTDEELLLTCERIWRKCNPHIGVTIQPEWYQGEMAKARLSPDYRREVLTKLLNVFRSDLAVEWLTAQDIRRLQVPMRVTDCKADAGWLVFVGLDFSLGDDLHAMSYLCFNTQTREFFADMDAWLTENSLAAHPMHEVFEKWVSAGWLHVSPGKTLAPELPVGRIAELTGAGVNCMSFLYDPYKAKTPINALSAYVWSLGVRPEDIVLPCRQNFATFNSAVQELDYLVKNEPPMIHFSENPMWPYEAGNMILLVSTDGMENRKPAKRDQQSKIDNFICLLEGLIGFDMFDGKLHE